MSMISVVVFKHGKPQPNASVQLNGPGGPKVQTTNGAGAVSFSGLGAGKYFVNAWHLAEALGTGFMNLQPGGSGVILIKFPQQRVDPVQAYQPSLTVSVAWTRATPGEPRSVDYARVRISGPSIRSSTTYFGTVKFSGLEPGYYSISAEAMAPSGEFVSGETKKRVHAGMGNSVQIFLHEPYVPREPCTSDIYLTPEEIKERIRELEEEIRAIKARIKLIEDSEDEAWRTCIKDKDVTDWVGGGSGNCAGQGVKAGDQHVRQLPALWAELRRKEAIIKGLKAALRCPLDQHERIKSPF